MVVRSSPCERHRGAQPDGVGPGHRAPAAPSTAAHPGHDVAVVEAQPQVHPHRAPGRDTPSTIRTTSGASPRGRHEVDDPHRAVGGVPLGLQHEGVAAVAPPGARAARRPARAASGRRSVVAEQRGEAGGRVEPGQAQPVDRPVPADQGGGLQVADAARSPRSFRPPDSLPELQNDLDVVVVALERLLVVLQRHPPADQPLQPGRVGVGQRLRRRPRSDGGWR